MFNGFIKKFVKIKKGKIFCRVNVKAEDLPKYYASCHFLIAPTVGVHACMGVSVIEAMSSGRPVIVSDSGGLPDAVDNDYNGIIVPLLESGEVDKELFAKKILKLVDDVNLHKEMSINTRKKVEDLFAKEKTVEKFHRMINLES